MAKIIEKWVAASDDGERKFWVVPVINPEGTIKYPRVSPHTSNSLIKSVYSERSMDPRLVGVQLAPGLEDHGWQLVADNYVENDMAAAWPHFQAWMRSTPMMGAGDAVAAFPEKYLPPGCAERKAGRADHQSKAEEIVIAELDERRDRTSRTKRIRAEVE